MLEPLLAVWFASVLVSVTYVGWDLFTRTPAMGIMKWGWVVVTLYAGPIGLAAYVASCREPRGGRHEEYIAPLWKQAVGSTIHCLAGDATGIIVAAAITGAAGFVMGVDLVVEYVAGFAFGLFVFQALFAKGMLGGSYLAAVRRTLIPEWLSMNAVMAGMVIVMVPLMSADMTAMEPTSLRFWGVMSAATLLGAALAYPVNVWLVARRLKHGMGTVRILGEGGHSATTELSLGTPSHADSRADGEHQARGSVMGTASRPELVAAALLTTAALVIAILIAAQIGDLGMKPEAGLVVQLPGVAAAGLVVFPGASENSLTAPRSTG